MQGDQQVSSKKDEFILNRKNVFGTLCQAPFTTMNFSQQGVINVCCANRTYEIGRVPDNTLEEIWNGEKIKNLRQEMDNFSFNLKCGQCELMLDSANFKSLKIPHYDTEESIRPGNEQSYRNLRYPYRLDFELNNTCNLECIMCTGNYSSSIRKNREGRELYQSPYDNDSFFEQLKPFLLNAKRIGFFGGEPFLVSAYYKIFDFLLEHNLKPLCYIQTNGTIYSEKIKTYLEKLNINLSVSLDAATKDTYEKIRKNAIFERTVSNMSKFKEILQKKGAIFYISPVIFTENLFDIKNILDIANKFEAKLYFHHLEYPKFLCLKYAEKKTLIEALEFYYSLKSEELIFMSSNSSVAGHNVNAFLDELKYIKYCLVNHDSNNKLSVDEFLNICNEKCRDKLDIINSAIAENNLDKNKFYRFIIINSSRKEDLEDFINSDKYEFIKKLNQAIIEQGVFLR
jgi:MoaA/NifB/PqqE/SkfB family radical SAM enzyme